MANYSLLSTYATVRVLTPTLVDDVLYCTIQTSPSGVIASMPVEANLFNSDTAAPLLTEFAASIESVMLFPHVIAGVGEQTIDPNGLLADQVTFTVEYVPTNPPAFGITTQVDVPVTLLDFGNQYAGTTNEQAVQKMIDAAYGHLKSAAGA